MFGHQSDVIADDQKAPADVPLHDAALDALTGTPTTTPPTNSSTADAISAPTVVAPAAAVLPEELPPLTPAAPVAQPAAGSSMPEPIELAAAHAATVSEAAQPPTPELPKITTSHAGYVSDDAVPTEDKTDEPAPPETVEPAQPPAPVATSLPTDLQEIKQAALEKLSPLVGKLDLSPEEKFKTTMMLIQASDDHAMITTAYELAQQITDEKAHAQALLDIVNEINYFTSGNTETKN